MSPCAACGRPSDRLDRGICPACAFDPDDFCRTCYGRGAVREPVHTFTGGGLRASTIAGPCVACNGTGRGH